MATRAEKRGSGISITSPHFDPNQLDRPHPKITVRAGDTCEIGTVALRRGKTSRAAALP